MADIDTGTDGLLHDIGHEVATVAVLVAAIRAEDHLEGRLRDRVAILEQEVDQLMELVGIAGSGVGGTAGDAPVLDLRPLLAEIVASRRATSACVVALLPGPPAVVRLDPIDLRRLVTNLVDNAVRAAGRGGRVEVEVVGDTVPVIRVLDDGPGPGRGPAGDRGAGLGIVRDLARRLAAEVSLRPLGERGSVAEVVLGCRSPSGPPGPRRGSW